MDHSELILRESSRCLSCIGQCHCCGSTYSPDQFILGRVYKKMPPTTFKLCFPLYNQDEVGATWIISYMVLSHQRSAELEVSHYQYILIQSNVWLFSSPVLSGTRSIQQTFTPISDPASLVIPFIGTINGGHVFPGMYDLAIKGYKFEICRCHLTSWNGQSWNGHGRTGKCIFWPFLLNF